MMMSVKKQLMALIGSGALTIAGALVGYFEGKKNNAYWDVIGVPTICYGHTKGVNIGDVLSDKECEELLKYDIKAFHDVVLENVRVPLSETQLAALISFTYNVGESNFKKSTLLKKLNSGDKQGACDELKKWIYAGGKPWRGLINRREVERWLCLM